MCVCLCVHEFHAACVKDRQQILGVVSLLQPQGTKGSNSGPQTWQKACLATQPSHPFLSSKAFSFLYRVPKIRIFACFKVYSNSILSNYLFSRFFRFSRCSTPTSCNSSTKALCEEGSNKIVIRQHKSIRSR